MNGAFEATAQAHGGARASKKHALPRLGAGPQPIQKADSGAPRRLEGPAVGNKEFNVLALIKGDERYVYVYDDTSREALLSWLRERVHLQGSLLSTAELVESATGRPLETESFERHLRDRYLG